MYTVKQVSTLTGISVRTLQYYDEINLFKPTQMTASGYRLYNHDSLEELQQILFLKELDFSLRDIKKILENPNYDKQKALRNQRELIQLKRKRLDGLLQLLNKLIEGESQMSFKEFDMSEYFDALKAFKESHAQEILKYWGDINEFDKMLVSLEEKESEIGKMAIKQYGTIEKYTKEMIHNMENFDEVMKSLRSLEADWQEKVNTSDQITEKILKDLSKDPTSEEIQLLVKDLVCEVERVNNSLAVDMGKGYWMNMAELYLLNPLYQQATDKKYGIGAANFIGTALKHYIN